MWPDNSLPSTKVDGSRGALVGFSRKMLLYYLAKDKPF